MRYAVAVSLLMELSLNIFFAVVFINDKTEGNFINYVF